MTTVDTVTVTFYTTDSRDVATFADRVNAAMDGAWYGRVATLPNGPPRRKLPLVNQPTIVRAMLEDDS